MSSDLKASTQKKKKKKRSNMSRAEGTVCTRTQNVKELGTFTGNSLHRVDRGEMGMGGGRGGAGGGNR